VDLGTGLVRVVRAQTETRREGLAVKDPKTEAGKRVVAIPEAVLPELRAHVEWFAEPGPDGLIFVGPLGGRLRRHNFRKQWIAACRAAGIPAEMELHFHDLRHTGNTLAAATGASLKELMARMGHASPRAALIYQHATSKRDQLIATAMNAEILATRKQRPRESLSRTEASANGTQMAREDGA
jgi:integrase